MDLSFVTTRMKWEVVRREGGESPLSGTGTA